MEVDGGGERGSELEERGEGEEGDRATVVIGHHAFDRVVVSDPRVAEFHGLDHKLCACCFLNRLIGRYIQVKETHCYSLSHTETEKRV